MAFIPIDKMKQLREAAAKGDERAKKILKAQLSGSDFGTDLDAFFSQGTHTMPAVEPGPMPKSVSTGNEQLDEWLRSNNIHETDEDYADALEEYYAEYPEQRPKESQKSNMPTFPSDGLKDYQQEQTIADEIDLTQEIAQGIIDVISSCDRVSLEMLQNNEIDGTAKKGAMTIIQEIKSSLLDAAEKLTKIKSTFEKKEEEVM